MSRRKDPVDFLCCVESDFKFKFKEHDNEEMRDEVSLEESRDGVTVQSPSSARYVRTPQVLDPNLAAQEATRAPLCIRGQIIGTEQHDHLVLKCMLLIELPD